MRRGTMMAHLRLMTLSLMVMPACRRASRRPSNAARSCARRGPARNVLVCLQTLKNGTLTHPSLWEDYCFPEHHGTIFHGKQAAVERIVRVLACLAEGLGIRATARVFEVAPHTVLQWLVEAAEQLRAFSAYFL